MVHNCTVHNRTFCNRALNSFVEPVPHLEELAQCLRADFVHVENKYGVFQSIPPEIFEHQLFESEELDIGPAAANDANTGTTSSSQQGANGNGVHSQGGELGQKSYGSPIAAFDPLFSWDAECAAVLGQRLPGSPNGRAPDGTQTPRPRASEASKWLSDKEAARLSDWAQMMPFREAFAWTTIPLFDSSVTGGVGGFGHHPSDSSGATTPRSPVSSFADGGSSHSLLSDFGGPPVLVEIPQLNRVKESYTTDELYGGDDGRGGNGVRGGVQFRALDFRSMNCMEPHTKLLHCLFVYPQCIALSKKFNIFIRVELRSDDSDLQKPAMELLRSAFSQVAPGSKTAMYHDEFKVRMPAVFTPQHHLLFTFFHVELAMRNEPPRPDGKPVFRVRMRMCSSIYPVSDRVREFFRVYDRHVLHSAPPGPELLDAINKLKEVELPILLQFLYPILNMLLCMIGNGIETLQVAAFRAMINIITNVQKASMESSPRNKYLVHFVDYMFDDLGRQQLPVYPGLCNVWRSLARSKMATCVNYLTTVLLKELFVSLDHEDLSLQARLTRVAACNQPWPRNSQQLMRQLSHILDEVTVYRNLSSAEKRNVLTSSTNNPDDELPTSPKYSDKLARSANNFFAEATKNDSKGTLREHLLRKMGVPGVSGSVNARMPLAQAMAQAQVSRTEASKVLRDGLPPVYKQKLDMWESNLAARVSLEVLDVLNTFFEAAAATAAEQQQQGDSASSASAAASSGLSGGGGSGSGVGGAIVAADFDSMDSIAGPLAAFLSIEFWRRFLPSLARVLETQGRSLLSNSKEKFLRNITFHLMRRLVFKNEAMRKAALASLLFYKSARRMKAVLTITLSELISDLKILQRGIMGSFEETAALHRLRSSIRALGSGSANAALLREYAVGPQNSRLLAVLSADTEEGRSQREELRDLEAALLRVLEASREHAQLLEDSKVGDKHVLVESYYGLSQAYAHVPDLHIMWLLHLCTAHQEMFAWAEAAQCTIAVAAIIMKEHLQAVQRICSVFNEEGRKHNSAPTDMDGFGATTLTVDSAVKYLQMGSNFFKKAEVYQFCAELLELMLPVHKHRRAYGQISPVPFKDGAYYRVGFYGSRFKNLDRKLGDIMEKLGKLYEQRKSGEDEPLHIIPDSRQVDPAALKPGFCYMQITAVEPVVGEIEDRWLGRTLEPHVAGAPIFGCFYFDTPFTEAGKTHAGGLEDQWKRRTLLYTMMTFPSVMQRLEVRRRAERDARRARRNFPSPRRVLDPIVREYSPIENAVQVIDSRTHALQSELEAQGVDPAAESGGTELNLPRLQSLQRLLQGSVNSGVLGVCIAFYKGVSEGAPQPKDERRFKPEVIQQLTTAILSFAAICKRGIAVHARASKDQEFHSQLVEGFECLVVEIGRYIPEIRSSSD
eukprot:jgi/Mesen1/8857/ME000053S08270